ncbi:type IV secretory system conjugative DNA transfer family protein [Fimbriiglobus ruber]|uniref:TraD/TraG TraM recognition site domain-containing protein n=1 Tax=Fimbriiglobus ruber TaxID=1908690 RepID=A0A225D3G7_9BACT|nr:TraM recognition domain-containing protein [Fimbriiglobus ruber]OWK35503.1 hypothetical protein FRUB_08066 [Fimbriiglobus ruber]
MVRLLYQFILSLFLQRDAVLKIGPGRKDQLTLQQCFSNVFISGMIGSGKTTGICANLALGLYGHPSRPGALILCQKPDESARHIAYMRQTGRLADLIHVKPGGRWRINLLDSELSARGGGVESAKALLGVIMEAANRNRQRTSSDSYWPESSERQMGYAMALIQMAGLVVGFQEVLEFCQSLPNSPEQFKDPKWRQTSSAAKIVLAASMNCSETRAFKMAWEWFSTEWPELSEKTRSIIQSVTLNTLDKLLSNRFADLITGETTFTAEKALRDGKLVIFDVPGAVYGPPAQWAAVAVKLLFQRAAMRRSLKEPCRPFIFYTDEAANFCVPELDAMFLSQSRQFKCICINVIQNIPLAVTALGSSEAARHQVQAWTSNHATVIGCENSDPETNKLLSNFAGEVTEVTFGGSSGTSQPFDIVSDFLGQPQGNISASWNQVFRPALPPDAFVSLSKGGKSKIVQAYVFQSGRRFSNGNTFIRAQFRQRF